MFQLLHCKYEYLQISAALGQTFVLFTPADHFFLEIVILRYPFSEKHKNMLKNLIVLELLHCK